MTTFATCGGQATFQVRLAGPRDVAGARALRHEVFCTEQALFACDLDGIDEHATTIVAVSAANDVVGTVRIHDPEPSLWFGSRLAVSLSWRRRAGLGAALIRLAVGTAHARGCSRFLAHVQAQNATMFQALHWQRVEECMLHGVPHWLMQADLEQYPPVPAVFAITRDAA